MLELLFFFGQVAFAQGKALAFVEKLSRLLYLIGLAFSVLMIMIAGFQYVASQGKVSEIHRSLAYIVIGIIVIIISFSLPVLMQSFLQ
jgi:hypothetical protein